MPKKVIVGLSGGVDSSAAIIKLQENGYEVVGVTFRFVEDFDSTDAVKVAEKLHIEHHILDYRKEFKEEVINSFINDYKNGLTPNPCVHCNRYCKFYYLFECMERYNADYIATGHYANIIDGKLKRKLERLLKKRDLRIIIKRILLMYVLLNQDLRNILVII